MIDEIIKAGSDVVDLVVKIYNHVTPCIQVTPTPPIASINLSTTTTKYDLLINNCSLNFEDVIISIILDPNISPSTASQIKSSIQKIDFTMPANGSTHSSVTFSAPATIPLEDYSFTARASVISTNLDGSHNVVKNSDGQAILRVIPEFSLSTIILLTSIIFAIVIYRIRFTK